MPEESRDTDLALSFQILSKEVLERLAKYCIQHPDYTPRDLMNHLIDIGLIQEGY